MIYLDTSVALSQILTEGQRPSPAFWDQTFVASRLLQYEVWNRLHARGAKKYRHERARLVLKRVALLEMTQDVLEGALQPFPVPVRTLDALHLGTMMYLRKQDEQVTLASYDNRLLDAAGLLGFLTLRR